MAKIDDLPRLLIVLRDLVKVTVLMSDITLLKINEIYGDWLGDSIALPEHLCG